MKNVRPSQFLGNLYRDMRDRRLLIPAIALVVALIAIPVLLKSHSSAGGAAVVPVGSAGKPESAAVPAVVTQELGVTQYRNRLDQLSSKNPFHQQFTGVHKTARVQVSVSSTGSSSKPSNGTVSSTSTSSTTSTGTSSAAGSSTSSLPPVTGGTASSGGSLSPPATVRSSKPTPRYYAYRVGVKVGEPGKLQNRPEVKRLTMLPSSNRPLATFLGVAEDGRQAIFQISTDVDSVKGNGRCAPQPANCQYLAMKVGDKVNLDYAPSGKRFNLVLTDIHAVVVGQKPPGKVSGKAEPERRLPKLGPG
jgi:hypothetical protein